MNQLELNIILKKHKLWLNTGGVEGVRANLSQADLNGANLYQAYLNGADLYQADLNGADLSQADLSQANLSQADLNGANLSQADLSQAYLSQADGIYSFGPVGSSKRFGYAVKHTDCVMIQLGCFWGTPDEAIEAVAKKYGEKSLYADQINLAVKILLSQEK